MTRFRQDSVVLKMDTQASFSNSARLTIRETYDRCVFCLVLPPVGAGQCAHLVDQSPSRGRQQVRMNSCTGKLLLNIFLRFSKLSVWASCLRNFDGALQIMGFCVRIVYPLNTVLLTPHSMPFMQLVVFHSGLHVFYPLCTPTSIHQQLPQQHTNG